jgi:predicted HTH domain antitoxin
MASITLDLPANLSAPEARVIVAVALFAEGKMSLGKAAEISGLPKDEFMRAVGKRGIPVFNQDPEELDQDLEVLSRCVR